MTISHLIGPERWARRMVDIRALCVPGHAGRGFAQRFAIELALDRLGAGATADGAAQAGSPQTNSPQSGAVAELGRLGQDLAVLARTLSPAGGARLRDLIETCLHGGNTLVPLFHLLRCARIQRDRGFSVHFAGLEDGAAFDLLLAREDAAAELVCDVVSAEEGREVHRGAWSHLVDRVDPALQNWLASHPGRYLLKMTLPGGLKGEQSDGGTGALAALHGRITRLLSESRRADHDEAAVLRLEPLLLAGAQAGEAGLLRGLRREFGPEAHLAVTGAGNAVFVMAARASREDEVAEAVQRRLATLAPARFTGTRPGILAIFIEDTDRLEWRALRDQLRLEGAARQFLTRAAARCVVAVTCTSRLELFGAQPPDGAPEGEIRFRNPSHRQSGMTALAPSVLSTS